MVQAFTIEIRRQTPAHRVLFDQISLSLVLIVKLSICFYSHWHKHAHVYNQIHCSFGLKLNCSHHIHKCHKHNYWLKSVPRRIILSCQILNLPFCTLKYGIISSFIIFMMLKVCFLELFKLRVFKHLILSIFN